MEQTIKNLAAAFVGESQARNRYTFYAKVAQKEGYEQIGAIFLETAEQEKRHAKTLFEFIQELKDDNSDIVIDAGIPTIYKTTKENLEAAIAGENHEYTSMYPSFADVADKEGFGKIACTMRAIGKAEEHHEQRYKKLLECLNSGSIFKKTEGVFWVCRECGYIHFGVEAPKECPSCKHPQAFFQIQSENY